VHNIFFPANDGPWIDPRQPYRLSIRADRDDVASQNRPREQNLAGPDDEQGEEECRREADDRQWHADITDRAADENRPRIGDEVRTAAGHLQHPQRDNERRNRPPSGRQRP